MNSLRSALTALRAVRGVLIWRRRGRLKCYFEPSFSVSFGRKNGVRSPQAEIRGHYTGCSYTGWAQRIPRTTAGEYEWLLAAKLRIFEVRSSFEHFVDGFPDSIEKLLQLRRFLNVAGALENGTVLIAGCLRRRDYGNRHTCQARSLFEFDEYFEAVALGRVQIEKNGIRNVCAWLRPLLADREISALPRHS